MKPCFLNFLLLLLMKKLLYPGGNGGALLRCFPVVLTTSSDCYKLNEIYKLFLPFIESQGRYLTSNNVNNG